MKKTQRNYYDSQSNSSNENIKPKKKMNLFLKILIVLITFPFLILYPFYFIFRSKRINFLSKLVSSFVYVIALIVLSLFIETEDIPTESSITQLVLTNKTIDIFQGQTFDPKTFISDNSTSEVIEIKNPVDINIPGEYIVIYETVDSEEKLIVNVLEDPITLSTESISLVLGDEFNPYDIIDLSDKKSYDINIQNNVDLSKPGVYSVIYSYKDIKKSINVSITKPNTLEYVLSNSEWLLETTDTLGFLNNDIIEVDGGNTSGNRQSKVAVDVGFGSREYWAFTNEYGQLVAVIAEKIILQDEATEILLGDGRYYEDEANVPGTEKMDLDNGHVIADSLGGVSNAYNITPQNSTLNRNGNQAYMEDWILKANGAENFIAIITYPNTNTQIPSHYSFTYIINGNKVTDEFDNKSPETIDNNSSSGSNINTIVGTPSNDTNTESIEGIDKNGNGIVTIAEAKAAGFKMPIKSDHWLYKYMIDGDNDGMVGE